MSGVQVMNIRSRKRKQSMKKQSLFVVAAVLCVGMGMAVVADHGSRDALNVKQADAAYRDGAYQAKIDVETGESRTSRPGAGARTRIAHLSSLGMKTITRCLPKQSPGEA